MVGSAPVRLSLCQNGGGLETMMQSWRSVLFRGPSSFEPIFDGVLKCPSVEAALLGSDISCYAA